MFEKKGVKFHLNSGVKEIVGEDGKVNLIIHVLIIIISKSLY